MRILVSVLLAGACAQRVLACDLCAIYAATEAQGGSGKGFFGGVAEQFTQFNTLQVEGHDVPNVGDQYLKSSGDEHTLSLQAVVSGETKGLDTLNGAAVDDTGITSVFLGPQINYTWSSRLSAMVGVDLPVSIVSSGEQIVPTWRIRGAVTWRF